MRVELLLYFAASAVTLLVIAVSLMEGLPRLFVQSNESQIVLRHFSIVKEKSNLKRLLGQMDAEQSEIRDSVCVGHTMHNMAFLSYLESVSWTHQLPKTSVANSRHSSNTIT